MIVDHCARHYIRPQARKSLKKVGEFFKIFFVQMKISPEVYEFKENSWTACGHSVNGPFKKSVGAAIVLHLKVKRTVRNGFFSF